MKGTLRVGTFLRHGFVMAAAAALGGCLAEDTGSSWTSETKVDLTVSGSVGDGPAANANITIRSFRGPVLANVKSDDIGSYEVALSPGVSQFPLLITATGGTDLVTSQPPGFTLRGAVWTQDQEATANLNPFSTLAFEVARDLNGGFSRDGFVKAQKIVVTVANSGLTTLATAGPMETQIDENNAAEVIKASETLGEIIHRTRNALVAAGHNVTADEVIERLGSDLIDTVIEGYGGPRSNSRTAAVATIVSAQVLLESMSNSLHVRGRDATDAMRQAIDRVSPRKANPPLEDLGPTAGMLDAANRGLSAAFAVTDDPAVEKLARAVDSIRSGMHPVTVRGLLPTDFRTTLNEAVNRVAGGDAAMLATVNHFARSGGGEVVENRPPVISGLPDPSVPAGARYDFVPNASDLDDDDLIFSITGKPRWASFSTNTGRISGVPATTDADTYDGITITVSDGSETATLGPFSITVEDTPVVTASVTLDWAAPTTNEDGTALTDLAGYKIYWGTTSGAYPNSVKLENPGMSTYVIDNLAPGTYRFVARSYNRAGIQSRYSNVITVIAE